MIDFGFNVLCILFNTIFSGFFLSELQASRMILINQPQKKVQETGGSKAFMELKGICMGLGMSKPPANITMFQFFSGIEKKVKCGHLTDIILICSTLFVCTMTQFV